MKDDEIPGAGADEDLAVVAGGALEANGKRLLAVLGVAAVLLAAVHLSPLREYLNDVQAWKEAVRRLGFWGPAAFFMLTALLVAAGVPRLVLCFLGGMLFGFALGFAIAMAGGVLGACGTFFVARWAGREWVARRLAGREKLRVLLERPGVLTVVVIRLLPITGLVLDLLFGLSQVRYGPYLLGTILGLLPSTAIVALVGSGFASSSLSESLTQISCALAGLAVLALLGWRLHRGIRRGKG